MMRVDAHTIVMLRLLLRNINNDADNNIYTYIHKRKFRKITITITIIITIIMMVIAISSTGSTVSLPSAGVEV